MNQKRVIQACNKKFKEPTKEIKVRHDTTRYNNRNMYSSNNRERNKRVITTSLLWHSLRCTMYESRKGCGEIGLFKNYPVINLLHILCSAYTEIRSSESLKTVYDATAY